MAAGSAINAKRASLRLGDESAHRCGSQARRAIGPDAALDRARPACRASASVASTAPAAGGSGCGGRARSPSSAIVPGRAKAFISAEKTAWASKTGSAKPPSSAATPCGICVRRKRAHQSSPLTMVKKSTRVASVSSAALRSAASCASSAGRDHLGFDRVPPVPPLPAGIEVRGKARMVEVAAEDHGMADFAATQAARWRARRSPRQC